MEKQKTVIGRSVTVEFVGHAKDIPAKVDTGADSSSVWATNISVNKEGILSFTLFGKGSPFYTGEVLTRDAYSVATVRSSSGHEQIRYRVQFSLSISGKRVRAKFNLSDRSKNRFPVLIGRRSLSGKFLVDVTLAQYEDQTKVFEAKNGILNTELTKNPYDFYKKYYEKNLE